MFGYKAFQSLSTLVGNNIFANAHFYLPLAKLNNAMAILITGVFVARSIEERIHSIKLGIFIIRGFVCYTYDTGCYKVFNFTVFMLGRLTVSD